MKIYKVNLDPSNPVEKLVKVPIGSTYGLQLNWNYEKFPTFTDSEVDTENGKLTNADGVIEENTSFTEINGQKIFTDLPVIENVGNTIIFTYGKNETFDDNKLDNFGAIKVVGVDTDDYDVDVGGGGGDATIEGISPDSYGGGPLAGIVGKGLVVGYPDFSKNVIINGNNILLASDTDGTSMRLNNSDIYTTGANLIHMNAPTINIVNHNTNDCINICSQTINLNGTVYINGEEYQSGGGSGGGSTVDYMYSIENVYGSGSSGCINLFIGNNSAGDVNDRVYINGNQIYIGSGRTQDDGETTSNNGSSYILCLEAGYLCVYASYLCLEAGQLCLKANDLCLETQTLDFYIDISNNGCWKINGYKINLDSFLQQFGEYVG